MLLITVFSTSSLPLQLWAFLCHMVSAQTFFYRSLHCCLLHPSITVDPFLQVGDSWCLLLLCMLHIMEDQAVIHTPYKQHNFNIRGANSVKVPFRRLSRLRSASLCWPCRFLRNEFNYRIAFQLYRVRQKSLHPTYV